VYIGVTQELINHRRGAIERKMLRDLKRLSRKGHDLEFRGQHGETPVTCSPCLILLRVGLAFYPTGATSCADQRTIWQKWANAGPPFTTNFHLASTWTILCGVVFV